MPFSNFRWLRKLPSCIFIGVVLAIRVLGNRERKMDQMIFCEYTSEYAAKPAVSYTASFNGCASQPVN